MAIGYKALRGIFHGRLEESRQKGGPGAYARGRVAALGELYDLLGLVCDEQGAPGFEQDDRGLPVLREHRARPSELSLRHIAESIFGHDFVENYYHPASGYNFGLGRHLQESVVDPSTFVDINTMTLAVSGLLNAEIMQAFMHPKYIGKDLVTVKPTKMNGQKFIMVNPIPPQSRQAKARAPGAAHKEVGPSSAYQNSPETEEQALKCVVTRETVFFDLTGQVLDEAKKVGDDLAFGMEKEIADEFLGVTNSFNRNGTSYNSYLTSGLYVNDHVNVFSDENDVDDARLLFVAMAHPETGRKIDVDGRTILCMPHREMRFRDQLFAANVQVGTQAAGNFPARWKQTQSQLSSVGAGGAYTVIPMTSTWYDRATASDGLNYSASDAKDLWFLGDFGESVFWMENWPITPWSAGADQYDLQDRGLISVHGANYRGKVYTKSPWHKVRNRAS